MSVLRWTYEYATLEEGEGQYDNINLRNENCVDAVYIPAEFSIDKGNPFIEALPRPREGSDVRRSYNRQIIGYNADEVANMSDYKRIRAISLLRSLRFPLPFDERLETTIYNTLVTSYRNRKLRGSFDTPIKYKANDEDEETFGSLKGRKDDAANAGFSLIGYSGCGKSTALGFAFDHIPQVIYHNTNGCRIPQIVYLNVSCFHNNNMSALYIGIGAAIDEALENSQPIYTTIIKRERTVGEKEVKVNELIERFNIGLIVFDEIQLLSFSPEDESDKTSKSSFGSLMTLQNNTKVAIGVVGTEEAYKKMFPNLQTARRTGQNINASTYCSSKKFFATLAKDLLKYQWFDHRVNFDKAMLQALYDESHGIIDQMVGIFSAMQYEYFYQDKSVRIDADYIRKVAGTYYPGLSRLNKNLASADAEKKRKAIVDKASARQSEIAEIASQKAFENELSKDNPDAVPVETIIKNVNVLAGFLADNMQFSDDDIIVAYNNIMKLKGDHSDEKILTHDVYTLLTEMSMGVPATTLVSKQKHARPQKTSNEAMKKALEEHTYVPK